MQSFYVELEPEREAADSASCEQAAMQFPLALMLGLVPPPARPALAPIRSIRNLSKTDEIDEEKNVRPLSARRAKILTLLGRNPMSAQEIAEALSCALKQVMQDLRMLLQDKHIERFRSKGRDARADLLYCAKRAEKHK